MFVEFFYTLRKAGIPVTPTAFLRLQKALDMGLIASLEDFYVAARAIMVKSERYFDIYDRIFARHFYGVEQGEDWEEELEEAVRMLLNEWLLDPKELAEMLGIDPESLPDLDPEELVKYFLERLKEQTERHDGGNRWIGTGGTSPVGHSGFHPGGMRVGGMSRGKSAIKVALERRYRDYTQNTRLTSSQVGEALRRLRHMMPAGPKDELDIEETIRQTVKLGGEIDIVFRQSPRDRLKVILMIDNGGWSMEPYVEIVQTLFNYAQAQFKDLKIFYFHNCIYDRVWEDPQRHHKPFPTADFPRLDPACRLIYVGDAAMAPYELEHPRGCINYNEKQSRASIEWLRFLAHVFRHSAWLNPMVTFATDYYSHGSNTQREIANIVPMFPLSLEGLERTVHHLMSEN